MGLNLELSHMECIFCKIVAKQIPATIKYEDDHILVFPDIAPKAPVHWLIIPKVHLSSMQQLGPDQAELAGHLFSQIGKIAELAGVAQSGYRIVSNTGADGGQDVFHLHVHLFGGGKIPGWS
jgi:histidine triad (HIT) family protein